MANKIQYKRPKGHPVPKWWIKWSEIIDLVWKDFSEMYYDPEEVEIMKEEWLYKSIGKEKLEKTKEKLRWANIYSIDKSWNKILMAQWGKKQSISIRLSPSDIKWIKTVAEKEGMPYQTLISSLVHKIATWQIKYSFTTND